MDELERLLREIEAELRAFDKTASLTERVRMTLDFIHLMPKLDATARAAQLAATSAAENVRMSALAFRVADAAKAAIAAVERMQAEWPEKRN